MELDLQHEKAMADHGFEFGKEPVLPKYIRNDIASFSKWRKQNIDVPEPMQESIIRANAWSAKIADEIQNFVEQDLPEEDQPINQNDILTDYELERGQAVGLTDTATMQQVLEKEKANTLAIRAKMAGLPKTATETEIITAEAQTITAEEIAKQNEVIEEEMHAIADALKARALAVGLPKTATEDEVIFAELKTTHPATGKKKASSFLDDFFNLL